MTKRDSNYVVDPESGCWNWNGSLNGYGRVNIGGKNRYAHRYFYELHRGKIPEGLLVLHRCDNKKCVNPEHLFTGTQVDNMKDMFEKGRGNKAKGSRNGSVKLTEENVRYIRNSSDTNKSLAAQFDLHECTVQRARNGTTWNQEDLF